MVAAFCLFVGGPASAFTMQFSNQDFGSEGVIPYFSNVRSFSFEIDLAGSVVPGTAYDNESISQVEYLVRGSLSIDPPTPSGFPAFLLNRRPGGEGPISAVDWIFQDSSILFEVAPTADLLDGLQLSELVANKKGVLLELDAREFGRLDRARYHPPRLQLNADGTGWLTNSNNSSGDTGTTNPATGLEVDVAYGDEYITKLRFDPRQVTIVPPGLVNVPEPGTALLFGFGLVGLATVSRTGRD